MNTTATILKAARDLIAKPENWTQGEYARDENSKSVRAFSEKAVCFCSVGALMRASQDNCSNYVRGKDILAQFTPYFSIEAFNDKATHSEVLDLFSKAIKAAEGEQS